MKTLDIQDEQWKKMIITSRNTKATAQDKLFFSSGFVCLNSDADNL